MGIVILSEEHVNEVVEMLTWWRGIKQGGAATLRAFPTAASTYIAKVPNGGIPALSGLIPGAAECEIFRLIPTTTTGTGSAVTEQAELDDLNLLANVYNLSGSEIAGGYILVHQIKAGEIDGYVTFTGGAYYKHMGEFELDEDITITDEYAWGKLKYEWGEGTSHLTRITGSGTGSGTDSADLHVKLHNFETHVLGTYEFYADMGDSVIAYYDYFEDGIEYWNIVIPECP